MRVKLRKCSFFQREIKFLGHLIRKGKIKPSPSKVEAFSSCEEPKTLKQLLSFLGLALQKIIEHFTLLAHELECATANRNNKPRLKYLITNAKKHSITPELNKVVLPRLQYDFAVSLAISFAFFNILFEVRLLNEFDARFFFLLKNGLKLRQT